MTESTTAVCRHCGERFPLTARAGRDTYRRHAGSPVSYARARYCSDAHRKAASRARISRNGTRQDRPKRPGGTHTHSAVTSPQQHIDNSKEILTQKTVLDPQRRANVRILGPARVLAAEFARAWRPAIGSDGIEIAVARLCARVIVS